MKIFLSVLAVVVIAVLIFAGFKLVQDDTVVNNPGGNSTSTSSTGKDNLIRVETPKANDTVTSPLVVSGEARGNWYFEGSFPIKVLDASGKQLGIGIAEAKSEWMTTEFVPFDTSIRFSTPTTSTGTLVLVKDNPSGLPEHDDQLRIPIRFDQVVSQTREIKLYFYNEQLDQDASGNTLCSPKGLVVVTRSIPLTNTPIQDALRELLKGPDNFERLTLSGTEFPIPGLELKSASLSGGTLTLTFTDPQNKTSGGSCRVSILRAQIEATAKQFGGVTTVRFAPASVFQP